MPSKKFLQGFDHELQNRAFAYLAITRMCERLQGDVRLVFWQSYLDLEVFNRPRYEAAALQWGLNTAPGAWTKVKAWLVSSVPKPLLGTLLTVVYKETLKYMRWLRMLRNEGPRDSASFLDYMIAQEEVQIEMMHMALGGRYGEIQAHAKRFFARHGGPCVSAA